MKTPTAAETEAARIMKEDVLLSRVRSYARAGSWRVYHTKYSVGSEAGWPDLVLCHRQHGLLFRELKATKGRVSPDQQVWLDDLTAVGTDAGIWRPVDLFNGRILTELHLGHR